MKNRACLRHVSNAHLFPQKARLLTEKRPIKMVSTAISSFIRARALFLFQTYCVDQSLGETNMLSHLQKKTIVFFSSTIHRNIIARSLYYLKDIGLCIISLAFCVVFRRSLRGNQLQRKKGGKVTKSCSVESASHSSLLDLSSEPKKHPLFCSKMTTKKNRELLLCMRVTPFYPSAFEKTTNLVT